MGSESHDKELEQYRSLLETPAEFKDGFGWTTVAGILFCGLVMMPGSIYLGLMTGHGIGSAASWVTVILFSEIARRAMRTMSKQELVVLLYAAGSMTVGPMGGLVYRAYLVGSDTVRDAGMLGAFPKWFCPPPDSPAILERTFFHKDWLLPIGLAVFCAVIGMIKKYTLGYFFFRLTSDIENLPFPLAPIQAQGAMALAEADDHLAGDDSLDGTDPSGEKKKKSLRWRIFSLGAVLGIAFGMFQVGIPAITGLFLSKPFFFIPQPFVDTTVLTESILPATPTGMTVDLGIILLGFVLPFWSVIGTFLAIAMTAILNPILHHTGVLTHWQPGMDTINTTFSNSIDFWMSWGVGTGLGIAVMSIFATARDVAAKAREMRKTRSSESRPGGLWATPRTGRGDYPLWAALIGYVFAGSAMVYVCYLLLPKSSGLLFFLVIFTFFYNPFISYVNARLLGISGQSVDIPFIKEASFFLSGAKGIEIWLAPVPIENYGGQAQAFRVNELTGVSFWSLMKIDLVALPTLFLLSLLFWSFIWHSDAIPSDVFPAAQIQWQLNAKNQVLMLSSTYVAPGDNPEDKSIWDSPFMEAIHPKVIGAGFGFCLAMYAILSYFGLPIMLIYGMIRGFGALPHVMVLEILGAMIGRYYFQKKFGAADFLRNAPTLLAGYFTGVGLIGMATVAMKLIKAAVSAAPF